LFKVVLKVDISEFLEVLKEWYEVLLRFKIIKNFEQQERLLLASFI